MHEHGEGLTPSHDASRPRVAVASCVVAEEHDMFVVFQRAVADEARALGADVVEVGDGDPAGLDADALVLTVDCRHFTAYAHELARRRRRGERRPRVLVWQMDPFFDPSTPTALRDEAVRRIAGAEPGRPPDARHRCLAALGRRSPDELARRSFRHRRKAAIHQLARAIERGAFGALRWPFTERHLLKLAEREHWARAGAALGWWDEFHVSTLQKRDDLARLGVDARFAPAGLHDGLGSDRGGPRDIDVAFLGDAPPGSHRAQTLERLRDPLTRAGLRFEFVTRGCAGEDRVALLNRARLLLHVHNRYSWDTPWMRFFAAFANGALVVSEPLADARPLLAGAHFVEAPTDALVDTLVRYARDDDARAAIVTRALADARARWSTRHSVALVLASVLDRDDPAPTAAALQETSR